jgi:hypothetical protein
MGIYGRGGLTGRCSWGGGGEVGGGMEEKITTIVINAVTSFNTFKFFYHTSWLPFGGQLCAFLLSRAVCLSLVASCEVS